MSLNNLPIDVKPIETKVGSTRNQIKDEGDDELENSEGIGTIAFDDAHKPRETINGAMNFLNIQWVVYTNKLEAFV